MVFLVLFVVPALVALGFFLFTKSSITLKEFLVVQVPGQAVVAVISALVIYHSNTSDTEAWNGRVTAKKSERVMCSHTYCCGYSTYQCGKSTCTRCSSWCRHHPYDVNWAVYTSLGERLNVSRVDWQGAREPPRWSAVRVGEPSTTAHHYENYIKASPDSLFSRTDAQVRKMDMPPYPGSVYDYYRYDHFVPLGMAVEGHKRWEALLSELNADIGKANEVNVLLVTVPCWDRGRFRDLERAWLGGKKNDVIVVASVDERLGLKWVEVMSWTKNAMMGITIRDELMGHGHLDPDHAVPVLRNAVATHFVRRPMADFKYLKASITPTTLQWALSLIVGLLVAVVLGIVCHTHDLFKEERSTQRRHHS